MRIYPGDAPAIGSEFHANAILVGNLLRGESSLHGMHESIPGQQQAPGKPIRFLLLLLVETAHHERPVLRKDYGGGLVVKDHG